MTITSSGHTSDRQQDADFTDERLIGTPADMSLNPGKLQRPLAQIRGAPQNLNRVNP